MPCLSQLHNPWHIQWRLLVWMVLGKSLCLRPSRTLASGSWQSWPRWTTAPMVFAGISIIMCAIVIKCVTVICVSLPTWKAFSMAWHQQKFRWRWHVRRCSLLTCGTIDIMEFLPVGAHPSRPPLPLNIFRRKFKTGMAQCSICGHLIFLSRSCLNLSYCCFLFWY